MQFSDWESLHIKAWFASLCSIKGTREAMLKRLKTRYSLQVAVAVAVAEQPKMEKKMKKRSSSFFITTSHSSRSHLSQFHWSIPFWRSQSMFIQFWRSHLTHQSSTAILEEFPPYDEEWAEWSCYLIIMNQKKLYVKNDIYEWNKALTFVLKYIRNLLKSCKNYPWSRHKRC